MAGPIYNTKSRIYVCILAYIELSISYILCPKKSISHYKLYALMCNNKAN